MSSVLANRAEQATSSDERAEVLLSFEITRRFCSSLTSITEFSSWKW
jgi:hypothetical protein